MSAWERSLIAQVHSRRESTTKTGRAVTRSTNDGDTDQPKEDDHLGLRHLGRFVVPVARLRIDLRG